MARSTNKRRTVATFNYPVRIHVHEPKFEVLDSVRHLNVKALERAARAEVEFGYVKTECCQHLVRAVIRKGMVTGLRVETFSREDRSPVTPELAKLLKVAARKARARRGPAPKFPVPVAKFMAQGAGWGPMTLTCIGICIFGWCFVCCWRGDVAGPLMCGKITIDMTSFPYPE